MPKPRNTKPKTNPDMIVVAILIPPLGMMIGGIRMATGRPGGGRVIMLSLIAMVLWVLLWLVLTTAAVVPA